MDVLRRMYTTVSKAVPAVGKLRAAVSPKPGDAPFPEPPEDGRRIAFEGVGLRVFGDPGDPYYAAVAGHMRSQHRVCSVLRARCRAAGGDGAPVVLDVGANIGLATLAMSTALPDSARLLAVEPSPRNLAHLRRNLAANGLGPPRVEVVAAAVGAEPGSLGFHESDYGAGSHLVSGHHLADGSMPAVSVPVETLDRVASSRGLGRLDFIKIDVEGFEPDVLAGAAGAIERFRPVVYMEFNSWTLIAFRNLNPRGFLEDLVRRFPHVLAFGPEGGLEPVEGQHGMLGFLHRNLVERGCVDDLVLCHDAEWTRGVVPA
jgi:FkbM family methyltransferase